MPGNLRDRLRRIQLVKQGCAGISPPPEEKSLRKESVADNGCGNDCPSFFSERGWVCAGHMTLRREIVCGEITLPEKMPEAAGIVMPGITMPICGATSYENLLFFDLETTGLSGGAGTMAFLAAFGRLFLKKKSFELRVTQYLLLDYPGESDFIEALLGEFNRNSASGTTAGVTMVSYNGKCFDSQILKTRCLMNGIVPPEYLHADLLYPARRLWKRLLPDCSQGTIEAGILGIDRNGDIPGAMAPEIWFSFLKNGDARPLLGICEHNRRDIAGLASIFSAMVSIAGDPFEAAEKINFDLGSLALRWYVFTRNNPRLHETGRGLLRLAAESENRLPPVQAAVLRALAIDSERRLKDPADALERALRGLELLPEDSPHRPDFERRIERLRKKRVKNKEQ